MAKTYTHLEQIEILSNAYGAGVVADLLGVTERAMQLWSSEPERTPREKTLRTLGELFTKHQAGENIVKTHKKADRTDKYIDTLERENKRLQTDLDLSLGELRHNALLARAVAETNQELLVEVLVSVKKLSQKDQKDLSYKVGIKNDEKYEILRSEGRFADIGR